MTSFSVLLSRCLRGAEAGGQRGDVPAGALLPGLRLLRGAGAAARGQEGGHGQVRH